LLQLAAAGADVRTGTWAGRNSGSDGRRSGAAAAGGLYPASATDLPRHRPTDGRTDAPCGQTAVERLAAGEHCYMAM